MMKLRRLLATTSLALLAGSTVARQPAAVPRCAESVVPANVDPSDPKSMAGVMRGAPRIVLALGRDRHDLLKELLARGEDPNVCVAGSSLLAVSAVSGDLEEMRILLDGGAHLEDPLDSNGGTALLTALSFGRYPSARLLIQRGADVLATDDGNIGTLFAVVTSHPSAKDAQDQVDLASLLLDKGVPVDARAGPSGATPLMMAALGGNQALVQLLLSRGANAALTNKRGETAEALARRRGFLQVADLFAHASVPGVAPSAPR